MEPEFDSEISAAKLIKATLVQRQQMIEALVRHRGELRDSLPKLIDDLDLMGGEAIANELQLKLAADTLSKPDRKERREEEEGEHK
jgi:hypothetical protein